MELGVRGLGLAPLPPPRLCDLGWALALSGPWLPARVLEPTCHLQVGSAWHIPLWRADSVRLRLME